MTHTLSPPKTTTRRPWIFTPSVDLALSLCWLPFLICALVMLENTASLQRLMGITFVISALHQPLTMALVYGDSEQRKQHAAIFKWSPLVMVTAILVGLYINFLLVAIVAGLWNVGHTLQQRYGITRIYGKKVGHQNANVDRFLLWSALGATATWASVYIDVTSEADRLGLGNRNRRGLQLLSDVTPVAQYLLPVMVGLFIVAAIRWVRHERTVDRSVARWIYLGSSLALIGSMAIAPIPGFIAYVGSHALEYFIVVQRRVSSSRRQDTPSLVSRAASTKVGAVGAVAGFTVFVMVVSVMIRTASADFYYIAFLTVGGLHFFYDGYIWKLRKPKIAQSFDLQTQTT